jgi:hypothetical protein
MGTGKIETIKSFGFNMPDGMQYNGMYIVI